MPRMSEEDTMDLLRDAEIASCNMVVVIAIFLFVIGLIFCAGLGTGYEIWGGKPEVLVLREPSL